VASIALDPATTDVAGTDYVGRLLADEDLPTADLHESPATLYVARAAGERVGAGGIEVYGDVALLRSVVVEPDARGRGLGTALCAALERRAAERGVTDLYLLTTTAAEFFADRGYERIDRVEAPPAVRATREFDALCSDAAVAMRRPL